MALVNPLCSKQISSEKDELHSDGWQITHETKSNMNGDATGAIVAAFVRLFMSLVRRMRNCVKKKTDQGWLAGLDTRKNLWQDGNLFASFAER